MRREVYLIENFKYVYKVLNHFSMGYTFKEKYLARNGMPNK